MDTSTARFNLLPEIPIDSGHTLDQLTGRFQTVKDGLPELIKNAKDQYSRLGILETDDRQIVVFVKSQARRLAVVDFAGAGPEDFEGWTTWSSRTANRAELANDIEGGHGNGGKAFMVRGSTTFSYMDSCSNGSRTRMGFNNTSLKDRYIPGYGKVGRKILNNTPEASPQGILQQELRSLGIDYKSLPSVVKGAFERRKAFTIVVVDGVKDWQERRLSTVRRLASEIPVLVADHGQTALTIETCSVWVLVDGELITRKPVHAKGLEPYPGFESLPLLKVPDMLPDPSTNELVKTGRGGTDEKFLQLETSTKNMRLSDDLKARNVIRIWNERNNVATWSLPSLGVVNPSIAFIYGKLRVPALEGEHLADAHRSTLGDTPLTRALERWVSQQVEGLADQLAKAEIRKTRPHDQEKATKALQELRDLMRRFLQPEEITGDAADDAKGGEKGESEPGRKKKREGYEFGDRVDEIVLEPMKRRFPIAVGTRIPLISRCFEVDSDTKRPVKAKNLVFKAGVSDLVSFDDGVLWGEAAGKTVMWFESGDGRISSNKVEVEVVACSGVNVTVPSEPLLQGQRRQIPVVFHTANGPRDDLLIDGSIDEPGMAWIGRSGMFTAGLVEGSPTLRIRFGPGRGDQKTFSIAVGPERVETHGSGGDDGGNIPEILFCGMPVLGMDTYSPEQRTHQGGEHFPTIIEEPQFPNIVWINPASKEASRVRRSRGGPTGIGGIGTKTFMHFVALKCFEILKRLKVRQELRDRTVSETQFNQLIAQAEMDCASFIDAAFDLSEKLVAGDVD